MRIVHAPICQCCGGQDAGMQVGSQIGASLADGKGE
jgi:hypothetical protein